MWLFEGTYTGDAKIYAQMKKAKECKLWAIFGSILMAIDGLIMFFFVGEGKSTYILLCVGLTLGGILLFNLILLLCYKKDTKCRIEINNDGFYIHDPNGFSLTISFAFYKIAPVEYYEDFIVVQGKFVLQKDLLVQGEWEELKTFIEKVEASLDTDNPIYQIEEPEAEFYESTVKGKRIFKKFVSGVSIKSQIGVFQYFATFELDDGREVEYEIGQELYDKIEKGQTGTLVLMCGNFFAFGDGEEVE